MKAKRKKIPVDYYSLEYFIENLVVTSLTAAIICLTEKKEEEERRKLLQEKEGGLQNFEKEATFLASGFLLSCK